ncbi:MAG: (Fe-S)-binding protein [Thermodesulfobacteriota bacterium]|nr:(Fe-S)-binding protein [Thermodesulfobacteriota bacterium]
MRHQSYIDAFDPEGKSGQFCDKCGLCLQKCPVMKMDKGTARAEHARLRMGEATERVLQECTFCYDCNHTCPHGMNPLALIMERVADGIKESGAGVPEYLRYLFTGHGETSVFADVYQTLPEAEQVILDQWAIPPEPCEEVLFVGCIGREMPATIAQSAVLQALPKYAPREACCGELPFRLGDFEAFAQTVERTTALLDRLRAKRMVCYCGSCAHSFNNIWRQYMDAKPDFEIITIWEWLWEKVQAGELPVQRTIEKTVALTDSCYGSELGDGFFEAVRGLHAAVGMTVVELENNRFDNLCCGMPSILHNNFDLFEPARVGQKKVEQVAASGAAHLYCYCPGCLMQLGGPAKKAGITTHYGLEEILQALGDEIPVPIKERSRIQGKLFMNKLQACFSNS